MNFDYQMLGRLVSDCDYYLMTGCEKHLWSGKVEEQIEKMREIYNTLQEKPEWLTLGKIDWYEKAMKLLKNLKERAKNYGNQ